MLIDSYAKINLYLDVISKRTDGYHEIETLYSTIDLHDSLKFVLTKKAEIQILSNIPELASVNNLVYKIAYRIISDFDVDSGVEIYVDKQIPISAGLGGGSSNAAVTIFALNSLFKLNMGVDYMNRIAAEYGSDINFFFHGGYAVGKSRGEIIELLPDKDSLELILVNPGVAISSAEAYNLCRIGNEPEKRNKLWFNDLEKGIREKYSEVNAILEALFELGCSDAMMSGSGSTCIGYFVDKAKQRIAMEYFNRNRVWCKQVKTLSRRSYQECFQSLN